MWSLEPAEFATVDAIRRGAERINEAVANAAPYGIRIGYHNHFAEFRNAFDGRSAYEVLLAELDPAVVLELDVYWAQTGGVDPVALAASLGERLEYLHLEDGPAQGMDDQLVPYGEGVVDVDGVVRANGSVRSNLVEVDRSAYEKWWVLRRCYQHLAELV